MCLTLRSEATLQTATEDIVVYKHIKPTIVKKDFKSGKEFTGIINGEKCSGRISIYNGEIYLCTNNADGLTIPKKYGYIYSWRLDDAVSSVVVDGVEMFKRDNLKTTYQNANVKIGKTYKSELKREPLEINVGLHSFKNLDDAKRDAYNICIFAKCIIPKGSKYYIGFYKSYTSYASNKLKYVDIVK